VPDAANDYPQYSINIALDNGMTLSTWFGAGTGFPTAVEDQLAVVAATALQNFDWSSLSLTPAATTATVALVRHDIVDTPVALPGTTAPPGA
jgi:hypothetical protein